MNGRHSNLSGSGLRRHRTDRAGSLGLKRSHSLRDTFRQDELLAKFEVGPTFRIERTPELMLIW